MTPEQANELFKERKRMLKDALELVRLLEERQGLPQGGDGLAIAKKDLERSLSNYISAANTVNYNFGSSNPGK